MKTQLILKEIGWSLILEHNTPLSLKIGDVIHLNIPEPIDERLKQYNKKNLTILELIKLIK